MVDPIPIEAIRGDVNPSDLEGMWELPADDEIAPPFNLQDFDLHHLQGEVKTDVQNLLTQYSHLFAQKPSRRDYTDLVTHKITLTDDKPVSLAPYRIPESQRQVMREIIQELLDDGIIEHSDSLYSSPALLVGKPPSSKPRLVVDYRKLNQKTVVEEYPMRNIQEILSDLGRATVFTTLDLTQRFWQIQMAPEDQHKTAFRIPNGKYEFKRLVMGLRNSPLAFQKLLNAVLHEFIGVNCFVYIDDIIIFSESIEDHFEHLKLIFSKLDQANLRIKAAKCQFIQSEIKYLGCDQSERGISRPQEI